MRFTLHLEYSREENVSAASRVWTGHPSLRVPRRSEALAGVQFLQSPLASQIHGWEGIDSPGLNGLIHDFFISFFLLFSYSIKLRYPAPHLTSDTYSSASHAVGGWHCGDLRSSEADISLRATFGSGPGLNRETSFRSASIIIRTSAQLASKEIIRDRLAQSGPSRAERECVRDVSNMIYIYLGTHASNCSRRPGMPLKCQSAMRVPRLNVCKAMRDRYVPC